MAAAHLQVQMPGLPTIENRPMMSGASMVSRSTSATHPGSSFSALARSVAVG